VPGSLPTPRDLGQSPNWSERVRAGRPHRTLAVTHDLRGCCRAIGIRSHPERRIRHLSPQSQTGPAVSTSPSSHRAPVRQWPSVPGRRLDHRRERLGGQVGDRLRVRHPARHEPGQLTCPRRSRGPAAALPRYPERIHDHSRPPPRFQGRACGRSDGSPHRLHHHW
jgi:hypothetical protein